MRTGGSESRARQRSDEDEPRHEDEDENGGVGQGRRNLETDDARETGKFCFGPLLLACPGKDGCVTTRRAALACHNSASPCPQPAPEWPELPPFLVVPDWPVARQGCNGQGAQKKRADWTWMLWWQAQAARAVSACLQPPSKGPMTDSLTIGAFRQRGLGSRLNHLFPTTLHRHLEPFTSTTRADLP